MFVLLYGSGWGTSGPTLSPTVPYRARLAQKWGNTHTQAKMPKKEVQAHECWFLPPQLPFLLVCVGSATVQHMLSYVNTHTDTDKLTDTSRMQTCTVCVNVLSMDPPGHRHVKLLLLLNKSRAPRMKHTKWLNALRLFLVVLSIFSRFAFIFGHFAFLCGRLHLYLVILWIILVFWFFSQGDTILHLLVLFNSCFAFHFSWVASISCCISLCSFTSLWSFWIS